MEHKVLLFMTLALLSLAVQEQAKKLFECDSEDLSIYYIGNKIPLSCNKGKLCNNASTELSKICALNYDVCWFRCKDSNIFTLDDNLEFPCPTGMKCNEKMEKSCAPCILQLCDDEAKWTCSGKTTFIMGDVIGRCYDGQVCKTENIPPCNNPCTLDDFLSPTLTTLSATTTSESSTMESKPTQPNNASSTVPTTTRLPIMPTNEPSSTIKEPETTTEKPITRTKEPEITPKKPTTTKESGIITEEPIATTKMPETPTNKSETITKKPEITTEKPITITKEPVTITSTPGSTTKGLTKPHSSDATERTTLSSTTDPTTLPITLSTGGGETTISPIISTSPTKPKATTSIKTPSTVPSFKIPDCNDGRGATNPCRDGPSPNIYYYKCKYYSPVWFDYDVKLCRNINSDYFCYGKVKCN